MRRRLPEPVLIDIGGAPRHPERLDVLTRPSLSTAVVQSSIHAADGAWMLTGGEPTLRADLPKLLAGGGGMRTDGELLARRGVLPALQRAGLRRVRLRIHSSRPDAHDWLVGASGALKRSLRGLQACVRAGLLVEVEITLTRPTVAHLAETVALVCRMGVRGIRLRRLRAQGAAAADFVALSPRLGLLSAPLEEALLAADAAGVPAWIAGVPACMAPSHRPLEAAETSASGCADCPADCPGFPADYAERFGRAELWRIASPPVCTQIRVVVEPEEPTRVVRQRLVAAAMCGPQTLRVIGAAAHPARAELLRELLRLSIPRVELAGAMAGLAELSASDRLRLRGFARIDAALLTTAAAERDALEGLPVRPYAVISDADQLRAHLEAGVTDFRLADPGGRLAALSGIEAVAHLLPPCLDGTGAAPPPDEDFHGSTPTERTGSGQDRIGATRPCPLAAGCAASARCPGLAVGWDTTGVAAIGSP